MRWSLSAAETTSVSCLLSLFTVRAAQTCTARRSHQSAYDPVSLLVGLAMHAPERRQPQRNLGDTTLRSPE
jgi:CxxC motif-containing protein (DUF1111 family)